MNSVEPCGVGITLAPGFQHETKLTPTARGLGRFVLLVAFVTFAACRTTPPTFNTDIAPIVFKNCSTCHRTGQQAVPFTLLSYEDVKKHAESIARVTLARRMPPWPPDPVTPEFIAERRLTGEQIDTIQRWVQAGAPEGDPSRRPTSPQFAGGWESGKPDLIVTMERPYMLEQRSGMHHDVFRNVVMRVPVKRTTYVKTVEFLPGA